MIHNKDKSVKDNFVYLLHRLELKDTSDQYPLFISVNNGVPLVTNNIFSISEKYSEINVDDDGNVILSDKSIERIARKVIEMIRKEGLT